jgi:H+/gluconate symporter-like permease
MHRFFDRLPRFVPPLLVGLVVALALTFAFGSPVVGGSVGLSIAVVLLWEERLHRQ